MAEIREVTETEHNDAIYLFGTDIRTIPCFRTSALTGSFASVFSSILCFLFTSNGNKAFKVGYGTFVIVFFPYWFYCGNEQYKENLALDTIQKQIKAKTRNNFVLLDSLEDDVDETNSQM